MWVLLLFINIFEKGFNTWATDIAVVVEKYQIYRGAVWNTISFLVCQHLIRFIAFARISSELPHTHTYIGG